MKSVSVYIPKPGGRLESEILPGSGIVGSPYVEGGLRVDFESNKYHACNLDKYEERIRQAAGRHWEQYPTQSRSYLTEADVGNNLIAVGLYHDDGHIEYFDTVKAQMANDYAAKYAQRDNLLSQDFSLPSL
jgi:hypothetical protein